MYCSIAIAFITDVVIQIIFLLFTWHFRRKLEDEEMAAKLQVLKEHQEKQKEKELLQKVSAAMFL